VVPGSLSSSKFFLFVDDARLISAKDNNFSKVC